MRMAQQQVKELLDFIDESPSAFHAVKSIGNRLLPFGFMQLKETEKWSLSPGGRYFVIRDDSSIIFFIAGKNKSFSRKQFR